MAKGGLRKVKLNKKTARAILRGRPAAEVVRKRGQNIADAAGPGNEVYVNTGRNRVRAAVVTATDEARKSEATNRTLSRAIDAGRAP